MPAPESPVMCTQIYGIHEISNNIGSAFEKGVEYSVYVNDQPAETFIGVSGPVAGEPKVEIPIGEWVEVEISGLVLEFLEVTEDSRCPANVVCIWAGQAKVQISALDNGEDLGSHELLLDPAGTNSNSVRLGDYTVALVGLNPYPGTSAEATPSDYVATLSVSGTSNTDESPAVPTATVRAEQVPNEPWTVRLFAEIVGGPDNNKELYCVGTTWQFGDGNGFAMTPGCIPWTSESKFQRTFEEKYSYGGPGTYELSFSHGALTASTTIEIN